MDLPENIVTQLIQEDHRSKWIAHSNHNVRCFTEAEIKMFTNNYKTMLGRGAFGEVYEGVLEDKSVVAVKRFIHNVKENFAKELTVHREINHKNVVRLIGYCVDENALMMVTEYIPKGNLSDILHQDNMPIPLDTRLRISIECSEALGYMHSQMYTQVIHGDIKPGNILLDDKFRAKLSDFGISRLINTENTLYTLNVIGSIGYMDPLFALNGRLTAKSDVYSFGVVLLELITRKKARADDGHISLVLTFTQALAKGIRRVREMFDAEIATPSDMKTIEEIAKLAGKCLRMELDKRPEMLVVAERLRKLRKDPHQGQERVALFSWGKKNKPASVETSATDSHKVAGPENKPAPAETSATYFHKVAGPSQVSSPSRKILVLFAVGSSEKALQFDLEDLLRASADVLGRGTVGTTYEATLDSGLKLAVKRLKEVGLPKAEFEQYITSIGAIKNEHIMRLRGYYCGTDEHLLVYDHMPTGSLSSLLHGKRFSGQAPVDWGRRLAISLAAARGVASIHSAGPSSCHGNIKSSNVLLSRTHDACVSEHGLTTLGQVGLFPNASGYCAPEVTNHKQVSQKADVYSFGVLLLELLTSRAPGRSPISEVVDLPRWVRSVVREEWAAELLDVELLGQQHKGGEEECMMRLLQLAMDCCSQDADTRPTMFDVVQRIEEIRQS